MHTFLHFIAQCDGLTAFHNDFCLNVFTTGRTKEILSLNAVTGWVQYYSGFHRDFFNVVDGMWGQWGAWAPCTLSCGGGTRTRLRLCNSPAPDYGGLFCVGTDTQVDYCNNERCPGK